MVTGSNTGRSPGEVGVQLQECHGTFTLGGSASYAVGSQHGLILSVLANTMVLEKGHLRTGRDLSQSLGGENVSTGAGPGRPRTSNSTFELGLYGEAASCNTKKRLIGE